MVLLFCILRTFNTYRALLLTLISKMLMMRQKLELWYSDETFSYSHPPFDPYIL